MHKVFYKRIFQRSKNFPFLKNKRNFASIKKKERNEINIKRAIYVPKQFDLKKLVMGRYSPSTF